MSVSAVNILEGCTLCGVCEQICPEVFELAETTTLVKAGVDLNQYEKTIREAADACPVSVIEVIG
jgi:ferredoxin